MDILEGRDSVRRGAVRQQTWWLLIALAIMAALAVIVLSAPREVRRRRVEAAIARFQASPSQSTAEELALLLGNRVPTRRQGQRILDLVLSPTVTTRSAYPADRIPTVSIEWPFRLDFTYRRDTYATFKSCLSLEGQEKATEHTMRVDILGYGPLFLRCGTQPLAIGTHSAQVRIDCSLIRYEPYAPLRMRLKSLLRGHWPVGGTLREAGSYKAHFEIPLEIAVVEAVDAEQVALVSDPRLNGAVRQSFTCRHQQDYPLKGSPRAVTYNGVTHLVWKDAPIALVFEPVLRLPDGREILHPAHHVTGVGRFRTRAGGSGVLYCTPFMTQFPVAVPGPYEATLVLRPDPNFAYQDPAIKAMWNGRLEFPIHFTVSFVPEPE